VPRYRPKAQVKANMLLWLNDTLLRDGFFSTVESGTVDVYGNNISELVPVEDSSYPDLYVWQSAFKNWVWESGIVAGSGVEPVVCSGIYYNGVFRAKDSAHPDYDAAFDHSVDFENGRVIFTSGIPSGTVEAAFSYKTFGTSLSNLFQDQTKDLLLETSWKDNPEITGVIIYPEKDVKTLPHIVIDIDTMDHKGYELGAASNVTVLKGHIYLYATSTYEIDQVDDLIGLHEHSVLRSIDFNTAPTPINYMGDINENFSSYSYAQGAFPWRRIYIDEISSRKLESLQNIERLAIRFTAKVYPNF